MLETLELRDFAIVDELKIDLAPGFNVLTGETGAGKSILIDALALLIGGRADSSMIRSGHSSALIQGIFREAPITSAARRLSSSGRSTARLDGELVTVGELATVGGDLVAIFGQHASQRLLEASEQRTQLDRLLPADVLAALARYREAFAGYSEVRAEIAALRDAARERARQLDILRFQRDEIDAMKLEAGQDAKLQEEVEGLRHAERIVQGAARAFALLADEESGALDRLAEGLRQLQNAGRHHRVPEALAADLAEAVTSVQAVAGEVEGFLADFEVEPDRLEAIESRLARIETLKRKYGDSVEAVLSYRTQAAAELERLENAEASLDALEAQRADLQASLEREGATLSAARVRAAEALERGVGVHLARLGMPEGRFSVELSAADGLTPHGLDRVRFLFSANPGEELAPLSTVASGGELSRLMLALNVVTGSDLPTLAFDEVDAGIGGQTARSVGALLKMLSRDHQVLVVTHLPQVAAFADVQFFVQKREKGKRTVTRVGRLEPAERELELARMLSGSVTEASLSNARELLEGAQSATLEGAR